MAGLPELDIARVRRWCQQRVPAHARDQVRVECDIGSRHLTIVECRPPWREGIGPDWTRFPIARLRYTQATRTWTLYWRDRNLRFHLYDQLEPSPDIGDLLREIDIRKADIAFPVRYRVIQSGIASSTRCATSPITRIWRWSLDGR